MKRTNDSMFFFSNHNVSGSQSSVRAVDIRDDLGDYRGRRALGVLVRARHGK